MTLIPSLLGNAKIDTIGKASSSAIINPSVSTEEQLTSEEQQIYEQGEAEILKLTEDYKNSKNLKWIDMGAIGEIRTNYENTHPEYKKVLNKRAEIRIDA